MNNIPIIYSYNEESPGVVYVVDDDESMRRRLEILIKSIGLTPLVFAKGHDFLNFNLPRHPSCLLIDVRLKGMSGFAVQSQMRLQGVDIPIVFITAHGEVEMCVKAMKAGAFDFLAKPFRDQQLIDAIGDAIMVDKERLDRQKMEDNLRRLFESLTQRQREVMRLMFDGFVTKQIAAQLNVSEITVKIHRRAMMTRMQSRSVADLIKKGVRLGLSNQGHHIDLL
jgi:FixJ family two-component response regulator